MSTEKKIFVGLGIATLVIVVAGAFLMGGSSSPSKPAPKADSQLLIRSDSNTEGPKNAKATVVEFGDYQCPACGAAHPIVKQITEEYKGKIRFVFRNFPLPIHNNAVKGALAAEAAGMQGKYFEMHDALYDNQGEWGESNNPEQYFEKYAKGIGLNVDQFQNDMKKKTGDAKIKKDQGDGNALGVNATPTFFINGELHSGGMPYDQFKNLIDKELSK